MRIGNREVQDEINIGAGQKLGRLHGLDAIFGRAGFRRLGAHVGAGGYLNALEQGRKFEIGG